MRLMSFHLTANQVRARTKTVTRRLGWRHARPGDRYLAVVKARGVPVAKREVLAVIEVVEVYQEVLADMCPTDVAREGFPGKTRRWFVDHFCRNMRCKPTDFVTTIRFRYVENAA